MFIIYHSNQLEILKDLMCYHLKTLSFDDPFSSEEIVVPSTSIIPWLEMAISEVIGITANINFTIPETFIWNILVCIFHDIPPENMFSQEKIKWKIMAIIPQLLNQPEFQMFKQYFSINPDKNQLFILASYLSELYYQYLIYRPEWLIEWENKKFTEIDPSQIWQVYLWYEVINYTKKLDQSICHIANLSLYFLKKIPQLNKINFLNLPKRIFIFNISRLPPLYLTILEAISKHIDIHLFLVNPCRHYWSDINEYKQETTSNPILKSWGKLGRDNFYLLSQFEQTHEIDAFVDLKKERMLSSLQQDILELEDYTTIFFSENSLQKKRLFNINDNSIQIHISYGLQRELEVLQDRLYDLITNDSTLTLNDIIVMVTDIDLYAPFIQAIFGNTQSKCYLPFHICDQSINQLYPLLVRSFISLLRIVEENFSLDKIFSLLEIPAFAIKFKINKENLAKLHQVLSEYPKNIKDEDENQIKLFIELNEKKIGTQLVEGICEIYRKLSQWRSFLFKSRFPSDWKNICSEIINDFFLIDANTDQEVVAVLTFIKHKWYVILEDAIHSSHPHEKISIQLLYNELIMKLNQIKLNMSFMKNCINFCALTSIRLIPFRVVCILGMNDGIYPRTSSSISYNLIMKNPKIGDISQRDNDRYLFLETLLSARDIFYLSYIGTSIAGNFLKKFPSIFINEILNYIVHSYYWPNNNVSDFDNNANKIRNHLQYFHDKYSDLVLNNDNGMKKPNLNNMVLPKKKIYELNIQKFFYFWKHPIRAFFNNRLGVKFLYPEKMTYSDQPFFLDKLNYYEFNTELLTTLIKGNNPSDLFALYRTKGLLPDGVFVEIFLKKQQHSMNKLAQSIKRYYSNTGSKPIPIDLNIRGIHLTGYLSDVQFDGLVRWRCNRLNFKDGLLLWLEHLIYCIINGNGKSIMFGQENTQWSFSALSSQEAIDHLIPFIDGYQSGMNSPILLLPKTGGAWLKATYDKKKYVLSYDEKTQLKARQRLLMTWMCDKNGERHDPYLQRLFRTMDEYHITEVINNAKHWLLPIMYFNQPKS
ncbi:MAG: exodeoxyribonuclease V subunit gamma [Candidatus Dasytiphilus stammeri]